MAFSHNFTHFTGKKGKFGSKKKKKQKKKQKIHTNKYQHLKKD